MVDDSRRCLLQSNCLLFQFAMRLTPADLPDPQSTFFCPAADALFHAALGNDPMLTLVLGFMHRLQYCYAIDEKGEFYGEVPTFLSQDQVAPELAMGPEHDE